jgi:hypothetical protein
MEIAFQMELIVKFLFFYAIGYNLFKIARRFHR